MFRRAINLLPTQKSIYKKGIFRLLHQTKHGQITVRDDNGHYRFTGNNPGPTAHVDVRDSNLYRKLAMGGSIALGETYFKELWDTQDLESVLRFFAVNSQRFHKSLLLNLQKLNVKRYLDPLLRNNSRSQARSNIRAHYDVGNDFYDLVLDKTMTYSCAIFEDADQGLHDAQLAKYDRVCRQLDLSAGDRILEIGSGWGGFAEYATENYPVNVTTTTISDEQYNYCKERFDNSGCSDDVTVLKKDYRELSGLYDKIVSIEMIEAVGETYLSRFLGILDRLLKDGGRVFIQSIVVDHDRYDSYSRKKDFIQEYVFPGGHLPSYKLLRTLIDRETGLVPFSYKDISDDYVLTLREWKTRLKQNRSAIRELGHSDQFLRLWDYYLNYCIVGFDRGLTRDIQLTLRK